MLDQTACHELTVLGNEMETETGEQQLPGNSAAGSGTTHSIGKQVRRVMWAQSRIFRGFGSVKAPASLALHCLCV